MNLDVFFAIQALYEDMKKTVFDIFKVISNILNENTLESLYDRMLEDFELYIK